MRMLRTSIAMLMVGLFLMGCATSHKIAKVQIGMTKEEVIAVMGKPVSISAKGESEYLNYALSETGDDAFIGRTTPYYVRLINGRVDSYGRTGDFDSTKIPTVRIETDENKKIQHEADGQGDLYTELKKLKDLKDSGILTEDEFEAQKKKLLEKY